jgi:hypothetical protein
MITLEPNSLQKSYVTKLVRHVQQRTVFEVVSSQLVILVALYCI